MQALERGSMELLVIVFLIEQRERGLDEITSGHEPQDLARGCIINHRQPFELMHSESRGDRSTGLLRESDDRNILSKKSS